MCFLCKVQYIISKIFISKCLYLLNIIYKYKYLKKSKHTYFWLLSTTDSFCLHLIKVLQKEKRKDVCVSRRLSSDSIRLYGNLHCVICWQRSKAPTCHNIRCQTYLVGEREEQGTQDGFPRLQVSFPDDGDDDDHHHRHQNKASVLRRAGPVKRDQYMCSLK